MNLDNRDEVEAAWKELPYLEFVAIYSPAYLLFSFTVENVQVFVFKKETKKVVSLNDLTITIVAVSKKEINLILKSSFTKILSIFLDKLKVSTIEGTFVSVYPFDFDKNDVFSPSFYIRAEYDNSLIRLETKDWVKLLLFIIITAIFIILYFVAPSEVYDSVNQKMTPNNLKEVYSALMSLGISITVVELITNLLIPKLFKRKYPTVIIKNFSNIFENKGVPEVKPIERPTDPTIA